MDTTTRMRTHGLGLIDDKEKKKLWHEIIVTNIWRCRK